MRFTKWQGCGNDFVLLDAVKNEVNVGEDFSALAKKICDRHFGVGADGVLLLSKDDTGAADIAMRIFNADGTEPQMCGNGIRCLARYAYDEGIVTERGFAVNTLAGVMRPKITEDGRVSVDMGEPRLTGEKIPVKGYDGKKVIDAPFVAAGKTYRITCVSMGNPHCVVFGDDNDLSVFDAPETIGRLFEKNEFFPEGTNVEFAEVQKDSSIRMRVWERGAGVTMACGTGACATLVAAALTNRTGRRSSIVLDGGTIDITWREEDNRVYMTGRADKVFAGEFPL